MSPVSRCFAALPVLALLLLPAAAPAETVRVLTFNLWYGGDACGLERSASIEAQTTTILQTKADVVALQEQTDKTSESRAAVLARELGWNHYIVSSSRAVISRLPMEPAPVLKPQPEKHHRSSGTNSQVVSVTLPSSRKVLVGVVHLAPAPYQPYHVVDGDFKTPEEAMRSSRLYRLPELESILGEITPRMAEGIPAVLLGDFNEPGLDWTTAAVALRKDPVIPFPVDWPCARLCVESGLVDAYRAIHPDPARKPGFTWTARPDMGRPKEVMDRIDLIYVSKKHGKVRNVWMVGEAGKENDLEISLWPSDHRAVLAELEF